MKFVPFVSLAAAGLATVLAAPSSARETTLRFGTNNSPKAHLNGQVLHPWAKRINEQGRRLLEIDVRDGPVFTDARNYFERAKSNVSRIG